MKKILYIQLLLFLTSFEKIFPHIFYENPCGCSREEYLKENNEEETILKLQSNKNEDFLKSVYEDFHKNIREIKHDPFDTEEKENNECKYRGTEDEKGVLGSGVGGKVLKVMEKTTGENFAIKKIVIEENNGNLQKAIENEIKNMIALKNNDHIIKIVDVYRWKNFVGSVILGKKKKTYKEEDNAQAYYIVMEYCEKGDLVDFIKNDNILDKEDLKNKIAYQLINAVYFCHENNIAHRDIKPDNVFLDEDYEVKLGDWGHSEIFEDNEKCKKYIGTESYISWEVLTKKPYDPIKNDLFSLGATLFALYARFFLYNIKGEVNEEKIQKAFNGIEKRLKEKIQNDKLRSFLTGLVQKEEQNRWGWKDIFNSDFYKELKKKYEKK